MTFEKAWRALDAERRQFRRPRRHSERDAPKRATADRRLHRSGHIERRAAGRIGGEHDGEFQRHQSDEHGEHDRLHSADGRRIQDADGGELCRHGGTISLDECPLQQQTCL